MRIGTWLRCASVALLLNACGTSDEGSNQSGNQTGDSTALAALAISPVTGAIASGQTLTLTAVATNKNGDPLTGINLAWQSSDPAVASVANGVVTGVTAGSVAITASSGSVTSNVAQVQVTQTVPPAANGPSEVLIDEALAKGEISSETALTYKVFALFRDSRLPAQFAGEDGDRFESGVLDEVVERFSTLSPPTQEALAPFLRRPADLGSWASPAPAVAVAKAVRKDSTPRCNGPAEGWVSVSAPGDKVKVWYDTAEPNDFAIARKVSATVENFAWPKLIDTLGFKPPMDDTSIFGCFGGDARTDFYIVHKKGFRGLTVPEGFDSKQAPVFVMINGDYAEVESATAHELMHTSQWSYRTVAKQTDYGWIRDATATWAIDAVFGKTDQFEHGLADCYMRSPGLSLDDRSTGHCTRGSSWPRDYGAYLLFQYIARTSGEVMVRQILAATTFISNSVEVVDYILPGGLAKHWPQFAKTLWNQGPIAAKADSFDQWDDLKEKPLLAPDHPNKIAGDLGGKPKDETELEETINNVSSKYYHFEFKDEATRSLMFHNTFYENRRRGEKVSVQALWKPEDPALPWVAEDWTNYEWIGFCRDGKAQRISELVIIVASAEWNGPNPVVRAASKPTLKRNNIGCWGFAGTTKHTYRDDSWSVGGIRTVTYEARFDYKPGGAFQQYTLESDGRLRVPMAAPLLAGGEFSVVTDYVEGGCRYRVNVTGVDKTATLGGNSYGTLWINLFGEAMRDDMWAAQQQVTGPEDRAYYASGVTNRTVPGTVTGTDCNFTYQDNVGVWMFTALEAGSHNKVTSDGRLKGSLTTNEPGDSFTEVYTWDLAPVREP